MIRSVRCTRGKRLAVSSHRNARFFEPLERRTFLCATVAELIKIGVPEEMISEGHISKADYETLPRKVRAHVNPHMIEGNTADEKMDWDKILGIPLHADPNSPGATEADALPDFFPQMSGAFLDTTTHTGRNLLRFGTQVNNQGAGPGSLISANPGSSIPTGAPITAWVNPDGTQNVLQPVYNYTGSSFVLSHYRLAGTMTFHPGHGHFHYDGYGEYKLRHRNTDGTPGAYVTRTDGTIVGAKTGFCLLTFSGTFTTEAGQNSSTLPGFNQDTGVPSSCGFGQGIRVGRYDVYDSSLEGQWLDVTGIPNGQYFIEQRLDASNAMAESNEANNAKSFPVTLTAPTPGGGITPDPFDSGGAHNDTRETAADLGELGVFTRTGLNINWGQDLDWFKFDATSSGAGTISTSGSGDMNLFLYDDAGNLLRQSTGTSASENVNWNFVGGEQYHVLARSYNSTLSSGYQIAWNIKPTASASATDATANELGGNSGIVGIARNGPTNTPLTVNFTVDGTATRGADYELYHDGVLVSGNSITIGTLAPVGQLEVRPIHDSTPEAPETVVVTLSTASAYVVGTANAATVTIGDAGPEVTQSTQTWQTTPHKLSFQIARAAVASLQAGDFAVVNLGNSQTVAPQSVGFVDNGDSVTATLTFNGVLPDGEYRATITGAGVTNSLGDPMFADFTYDFFTFAGDANHDGTINLSDFNVLAENFGQGGRDASTGDFNYDGIVNLSDFNILAQKFGTSVDGTGTRTAPPSMPRFGGTGGTPSPFGKGGSLTDDEDGGALGELA